MKKFFSWLKNSFADAADELNLAALNCQIADVNNLAMLAFYMKARKELLARIEAREDQQQQGATAQ